MWFHRVHNIRRRGQRHEVMSVSIETREYRHVASRVFRGISILRLKLDERNFWVVSSVI